MIVPPLASYYMFVNNNGNCFCVVIQLGENNARNKDRIVVTIQSNEMNCYRFNLTRKKLKLKE